MGRHTPEPTGREANAHGAGRRAVPGVAGGAVKSETGAGGAPGTHQLCCSPRSRWISSRSLAARS